MSLPPTETRSIVADELIDQDFIADVQTTEAMLREALPKTLEGDTRAADVCACFGKTGRDAGV